MRNATSISQFCPSYNQSSSSDTDPVSSLLPLWLPLIHVTQKWSRGYYFQMVTRGASSPAAAARKMRKVHRTPSWRKWRKTPRRRRKTRILKCESWIRIRAASDEKIQPAAAPTPPRRIARSGNRRRHPLHHRAAFRYKTVRLRVKTDRTVLAAVVVAVAAAVAAVEVAEVIVIPVANPEERGRPSRTNS